MLKSWSRKLAALGLALISTGAMVWLLTTHKLPFVSEPIVYIIKMELHPVIDINCWDRKHHTPKDPCPVRPHGSI